VLLVGNITSEEVLDSGRGRAASTYPPSLGSSTEEILSQTTEYPVTQAGSTSAEKFQLTASSVAPTMQ